MNFELTKAQTQQYNDWVNHCDTPAGTIGGRISFVFTPTGLGTCIEIQCICGEKLNVTEYDSW